MREAGIAKAKGERGSDIAEKQGFARDERGWRVRMSHERTLAETRLCVRRGPRRNEAV